MRGPLQPLILLHAWFLNHFEVNIYGRYEQDFVTLNHVSCAHLHDLDPVTAAGYFAPMKVRDLLILLKYDGWYLVATEGSHRQFKHATKPGRVTIPGTPNDDLPPGTLNSILRQSGLKK